MPFESGSTALMICSLSDKMPDDFLERLAKYSAGKLDDVKDCLLYTSPSPRD